MVVRVARVEDAPAMARINVGTYGLAHRGHMEENVDASALAHPSQVEESERNWARTLRKIAEGASPRECVYVALDEAGAVVGFAIGGPATGDAPEGTGEVYNLGVAESHHRRGHGRRLVQAVAAHLAQMGMPALIIGCLVVNRRARRFYEALGGRVVGERDVDEDGPEVIYGWTDTRGLVATGGAEPGERQR
jgi:ribosomal protein S18 acetylase RimI-like enzyme